MVTEIKTLGDFETGTLAPCGLDQTQVVDGKRVYPPTRSYDTLAELGVHRDKQPPIKQPARDDR